MEFIHLLFDPIVTALEFILTFLYNGLKIVNLGNYGLAIIVLTVIIKVLLYPLTVKQVKSMKAMQRMQPKMKKLQTKYKGDPKKLQEEMGKLYSAEGVNPMAGCLPVLAQMPILMAMFYALQNIHYEAGQSSFLWIADLSSPDHLYILPILSALTTFLVQYQTSSTTPGNGAQKKIMNTVMPLFIGYISMNFAAGLVLYWVMNNVMQLIQQYFIDKKEGVKPIKDN